MENLFKAEQRRDKMGDAKGQKRTLWKKQAI
jgi:hypothetical protein